VRVRVRVRVRLRVRVRVRMRVRGGRRRVMVRVRVTSSTLARMSVSAMLQHSASQQPCARKLPRVWRSATKCSVGSMAKGSCSAWRCRGDVGEI